jgi:hypothetical protein
MKATSAALTALAVIVFSALPVESNHVGVFTDTLATGDVFYDQIPGDRILYVVHTLHPEATGSRFRVVFDPGVTCVATNLEYLFAHTGDLFSGVTFDYGLCRPLPLVVARLHLSCFGTSQACSFVRVEPDPASTTGDIDARDCTGTLQWGTGGMLLVNPDNTCYPVPTEDTTWGKIKSMYR